MIDDLKEINDTKRTQVFFVSDGQVKIERRPDLDVVIVRIPGTRQRMMGRKPLPAEELVYYVTMSTIPRNTQNQYGIIITSVILKKTGLQQLVVEDYGASGAQTKRKLLRKQLRRSSRQRINEPELKRLS